MSAVAGFGIGGVSQVVNKGYPKAEVDGCDCGSCAMAGFGICCVRSFIRFCYRREPDFMEMGSEKGRRLEIIQECTKIASSTA